MIFTLQLRFTYYTKKQHVDINFYTPSSRPVVEKGHTLLNNYKAVCFVFFGFAFIFFRLSFASSERGLV